jgi:hypothetical protein
MADGLRARPASSVACVVIRHSDPESWSRARDLARTLQNAGGERRSTPRNGDQFLDNDKVFAAYALILIAGVTSTIATSVMVGFASLPSPLVFFEHVALGLSMRSAYKFIGGWNWADWTVTGDAPSDAIEASDMLSGTGHSPNAEA